MTKGRVVEETFDEWAERVGLRLVGEDEWPSQDDWIIQSTWTISGPAPECLAATPRYRPVPGGKADPAVLPDEDVRQFKIVFENAEDGGLAIYKEFVADGTREWLCGYGPTDAALLLTHALVSLMMNHANIEDVPVPEDEDMKSTMFWIYARDTYDIIVRAAIKEEDDD